MKICTKCGMRKYTNEFGLDRGVRLAKCKQCVRELSAEYAKTDAGRRNAGNRQRTYRFRMTTADYDAMLEAQGGGCAICGSTDPKGRTPGRFEVDHDHSCCPGRGRTCGKCVRGLLCAPCNRGLGSLQDSPELLEKAIAYLRR